MLNPLCKKGKEKNCFKLEFECFLLDDNNDLLVPWTIQTSEMIYVRSCLR